jgi:acyl carrier protein
MHPGTEMQLYLDILRRYLPMAGTRELLPDQDLAALGLDSLAMVGLLLELEDSFDTSFPDEFLTAQTFATVGSLWAIVTSLIEPADA